MAGHTTVAAAVAACQTCHEAAPYMGMLPSSATTAGDSRPTAFDKSHPTTGDCNGCHTTTPTFLTNQTGSSAKPANHIPTSAPCAQCHTTAGNYALYSVTGTHQGVTQCVTCHGPTVATTFANITIVSTPGNHIPIGSLDCNGSGCHSTTNVNAGGFRLGSASIASPTLGAAGHTTVAAAVAACQTCHEAAPYMGMLPSSGTTAGDSRPSAALDAKHPASGDCGSCHITTPTFASNVTGAGKPANHIPTSAPCAQCHTTSGNYALYSVTGTHQGVTGCLTCHGPTVATTFANVTIVSTPGNHIPIGTLDCNGSGCHTATNVNAGGFKLGSANIASPTLSVAGHATVVGVVGACQTCHESAPYLGMLPSTATAAADSRPTAFDKSHPTTGDCSGCHTTAPTFATNVVTGTKPANHIPTSAPCAQCHFSPGNFASYSVTGTHQGVTQCLTCHAPAVATTFANITIVSTPGNHFPIGTLDCNGSGCHTVTNVNTGGFKLGSANIASPTLSVAGHTTIAAAVTSCQTCHESAPYVGMLASTATTAGDSRPTALDKSHPTTGDCNGCHTTSPTFITNQTGSSTKPANHIPTTAACAQCHTTAGNYALYSVTGTHQGVTKCLTCHAPAVATTFANITIVSTPGNHFPIGTLDCNGSGCHTVTNVNAGGFKLGSANIAAPTLTVAGHTTIAAAVTSCQTCHESAPYVGMLASTATTAGDSRPSATLDKSHPSTGDCNGCHTTSPTFITNQTGSSTKPANHIPTTAACAQCHTTAGNYALYSVTGTHQGVTKCLTCHAPAVATTFANITIVSTPGNHIPIGTLDCNGSGCHTVTNVNAGGFKLGTANINTPTLTVAGHTTVAAAVSELPDLPPERGVRRHGGEHVHDRRGLAALGHAGQEPPDHRGLQRLPHHDADVRQEPDREREACEPHPDDRGVRPVPHHRGQLRALLRDRHAPGRDDLPHLSRPRGRHDVCQHHHRQHAGQPHPDRHARLQPLRLPHGDQRERGRLPHRGGQREHPDADGRRPHQRRHRRAELPDLSPDGGVRRHGGEHLDDRRGLAAVGHARLQSPRERGLQRLPHHHADVLEQRDQRRQAHEPHPDQCALRAMPHHRGQLRALRDGRHRAQGDRQQLCAVPCLRPELLQHGAAHPEAARLRGHGAYPRRGPQRHRQDRLRAVSLGGGLHQLRRHGHEALGRDLDEVHELP